MITIIISAVRISTSFPSSQLFSHIHVLHATPQTALNALRLPPKDIHDKRPAQAGKHGPRILLYGLLDLRVQSLREQRGGRRRRRHPGTLQTQSGECQHDPCEHVDHDLLRHTACAVLAAAKHEISAHGAGEEGVVRSFLPRPTRVEHAQYQHARLVYHGEGREVAGVLPRGFEDEPDLFPHGAAAEEENHDESVGEAHFGAVDGAIAGGFQDGQQRVQGWRHDDGVEGGVKGFGEGGGGHGGRSRSA